MPVKTEFERGRETILVCIRGMLRDQGAPDVAVPRRWRRRAGGIPS